MTAAILKFSNPIWVLRRIRELGFSGLLSDVLVKKLNLLPVEVLGPILRFFKIIFSPVDFLSRKFGVASYVAAHGARLQIPEALGFSVCNASDLPEQAAALKTCQKVLLERQDILARYPDRYGINLLAAEGLSWTSETLDLRPYDTILDLAISPPLVAAAARYLGEIPVLTSVQIYCTTERESIGGNNYFHFDKDHRMVKFWMAVSDITEESGPFTFYSAADSETVRNKIGYFGRLSDEQVYSVVPANAAIEFKGPAGAMLLVDTCRCVHFGSRTKKGPRVMLLLQYQSAFSWFESSYYYLPVIYNRSRYQDNPVARRVFAAMLEQVPGKLSK